MMGDSSSKKKDEKIRKESKHIVLVHGACHGAWCWYKVKPLLEASVSGHRVTVLDMAASGINHHQNIHEIKTLADYSQPLIKLMASLSDDQRVILVGHSLGGLNLALVMEMFPHKIELAVFLAAFMPDTHHPPSFIFDQFIASVTEGDKHYWLDTEFNCVGEGGPKEALTTMLFGPEFLAKLYHLCPTQDYELGMALKRPSSMFAHDLWKAESKFTADKYGGVRRFYVLCEEDKGIPQSYQRWMIQNFGLDNVKVLQGSDHMPMFSMPNRLSDCLLHIFDYDIE